MVAIWLLVTEKEISGFGKVGDVKLLQNFVEFSFGIRH